jgi:hypothetical protein
MNTNKLTGPFGAKCLAIAGSLALAGSAHALTVSNGDLFLGFRVTGGTGSSFDYLIDIGQASLYRDATGSFVLNNTAGINIGNIGADLTSIFGANWYTRNDLYWGVVGTVNLNPVGIDAANTEYASKGETTFGTPEAPWNRRSNSQQGSANTAIGPSGLTGSSLTGASSTANSTRAVQQNSGDANSWYSYVHAADGSGTSFNGSYNSALEGSFGGGTGGSALDLFRMTTSTTAGLPGTYLGRFTTDTSGNITFTPTAVVPEPSALTALAGGAALLGLMRRRSAAARA